MAGDLVAYSDANPGNGENIVNSTETYSKKKRVVVLGTGWAGTIFLKNLKNSSYDVQVISPRNYFAFTPLLPSVTCGTVEPCSIVEPIRNIVRKKNVDVHFWEAECYKIDVENKKVYCQSSLSSNPNETEEIVVNYDYLVISIGARVNTFNIPGVAENCHFLKDIEDARNIRRTIVDCFERASLPNLSDEERNKILHFVVGGGGPTGVEFAAELHDYVYEDLVKLYSKLKDAVQITLLEATDHILNIRALATDEWLRVEGCDNLYALGDCATINQRKVTVDSQMKNLPATAQVATQQVPILLIVSTEWRSVIKILKDRFASGVKDGAVSAPSVCSFGRGTDCCPASWRLGFNWSQHSMAMVFCLCKQISQLANKSIGHIRLGKAFRFWTRLELHIKLFQVLNFFQVHTYGAPDFGARCEHVSIIFEQRL